METFSVLLAICAGNTPIPGEFPAQRPVTGSFDVSVDLRLNKNGWVNNREAGDFRRHRAHYDVIIINWVRMRLLYEPRRSLFCVCILSFHLHEKRYEIKDDLEIYTTSLT